MGAVKRTHHQSVKNEKINKAYNKYCHTHEMKTIRWVQRFIKKRKRKRQYPNKSHLQSEMLKSCGMPYKHYRLHEKELDAYCAFLDDMIINGISGGIEKPVGLISHSLVPQPKVRQIVITTNAAYTSPELFDEMREHFRNQPDFHEWKKSVLEKWIFKAPSFSEIKIDDPADAIRYEIKAKEYINGSSKENT